jgi:ankyrin repeat protein
MTSIHQACRNGDKNLVTNLLKTEYSYHINTRDIYGFYPLHYAIHEGYYDISLLLLSNYNIEVNSRDFFGFTPLHYSILNGNNELTDLLIEYNANASLETFMGSSALLLSAKIGHDDISSNLLDASTKYVDSSDYYGFNSIYYAAFWGQLELTKFLLQSGMINNYIYILIIIYIF